MSVARVMELISASTKSFEDAIKIGVARAVKTLKNVEGVWVDNQKCVINAAGRCSGRAKRGSPQYEAVGFPALRGHVVVSAVLSLFLGLTPPL